MVGLASSPRTTTTATTVGSVTRVCVTRPASNPLHSLPVSNRGLIELPASTQTSGFPSILHPSFFAGASLPLCQPHPLVPPAARQSFLPPIGPRSHLKAQGHSHSSRRDSPVASAPAAYSPCPSLSTAHPSIPPSSCWARLGRRSLRRRPHPHPHIGAGAMPSSAAASSTGDSDDPVTLISDALVCTSCNGNLHHALPPS